MKLAFVLSLIFCAILLTSAGKKRSKLWKRIYNNLKDIPRDVDLVHVIESSSGVGSTWFDWAVCAAQKNTIWINERRPIAEDGSRVALIRFSSPHLIDTQFHLGDYNKYLSVLAAIGQVPFHNGSSVAIGNALQTARYEIQNHEEEDLKHTNYKMVWLYSSGKNTAGLYDPFEEIQKLKDNYKSGVRICVTPIGTHINTTLLKEIASPGCYIPMKPTKSYRKAWKKP